MMDTNIEITNINKHIYMFDSKKRPKNIINHKKITKIVNYDFYSINEKGFKFSTLIADK